MRWIFLCCILLAGSNGLLISRPKRHLWSIKDFITSKIFGTETIVIQLPKIPKNETARLFKIKGYDNILLKVTRKPDVVKPIVEKAVVRPAEPVMVSPEVAIIGNYLGTTTEGDTLLALDIAKNLLKSGILNGERIVQIREPENSNMAVVERDPVYLLPAVETTESFEIINPEPVAIYPPRYTPIVVGTKVKYAPVGSKYSYQQQGENIDMKFESYNNQDVIVTRTDRIPEKPKYITVRLAEIASIASNPKSVTSNQQRNQENVQHPTMEPAPIQPFNTQTSSSLKPDTKDKITNIPSNSVSDDVPSFIKESKEPFDIRNHLTDTEIDKLNKFINAKLYKNNAKVVEKDEQKTTGIPYYSDINQLKNMYGDLVHRYVYQQLGDNDQPPTVVNIEDPKLNETVAVVESSEEIPKDFVYVPPLNIDVPPLPTGKPKDYDQENKAIVKQDRTDDIHGNDNSTKFNYKTGVTNRPVTSSTKDPNEELKSVELNTTDKAKTSVRPTTRGGTLKTNVQTTNSSVKQNSFRRYRTTARPFTGGPVF